MTNCVPANGASLARCDSIQRFGCCYLFPAGDDAKDGDGGCTYGTCNEELVDELAKDSNASKWIKLPSPTDGILPAHAGPNGTNATNSSCINKYVPHVHSATVCDAAHLGCCLGNPGI